MTSTETQEDTQATPVAETSTASPENATPTATGEIVAPEHSHDGSHEHHHHAQPTLNPELTRTVEVEAPASDVN